MLVVDTDRIKGRSKTMIRVPWCSVKAGISDAQESEVLAPVIVVMSLLFP